jgi:CheY-like chemotaxis protein
MKRKILAVDDDPTIRGLVSHILSNEGYEVILAENGALGIAKLQEENFTNDLYLILMDVMMPELTGLQALSRIKEDNLAPQVPVIMLTAEAKPDDVMTGYNKGADYYITKPFTRQQLMHGISLVTAEE